MSDIRILAIDTSCDETSAAVIENGRKVCANVISSQIKLHEAYGGVVPELASRMHIESIDIVIAQTLKEAGMQLSEIDCIAATYGPGLVGALLTGLLHAKAMALALDKPFIGVNHIEGHISSNYLETTFAPPFVCLVVSGGHTNLVYVSDYGQYETLGHTRDDAAGEAYDKVARVLGLGYPGGPRLDKLAAEGDANAISFPKAFLEDGSYDFSFSGLKSAVINYLNKCKMMKTAVNPADVAASFQKAVIDVLVGKTIAAAKEKGAGKIALAGGVASNSALRARMQEKCAELDLELNIPKGIYCTDNGAMIGAAAYFKYQQGAFSDIRLNAEPSLRL